MRIQSYKVLEFTKEPVTDGVEVFITKGGNTIEIAPEWVRTNEYFIQNVADGAVLELGEVVSSPTPVAPEAPANDDDEPGFDDSTLDVKSLAAKIGLKIGETKALLKNTHGFEATNGATLLDQALFEQVVAEDARVKAGF